MNLVCPVCGSEYLGWVTRCSSCGVALVPPGEAPNPLDLPEEEQVVYELGAWPLDQQAEAAAVLAESGIPHSFDGSDVIVHIDHEAEVDALFDAIEAESGPFVDAADAADAAEDREDDDGELAYELEGWGDEHRQELETRLQAGGVPYRMELGALVVDAGDEPAVDFIVAEVRGAAPSLRALANGEVADDTEDTRGGDGADDADTDEADDTDDGELMSELFDVAARFERRPDDRDALADFATLNAAIDPDEPPFGIDQISWEKVIAAADDLADALTGEGGPEPADEAESEVAIVVLAARRLRASLRPFV